MILLIISFVMCAGLMAGIYYSFISVLLPFVNKKQRICAILSICGPIFMSFVLIYCLAHLSVADSGSKGSLPYCATGTGVHLPASS